MPFHGAMYVQAVGDVDARRDLVTHDPKGRHSEESRLVSHQGL
jgi:hypothetical protein